MSYDDNDGSARPMALVPLKPKQVSETDIVTMDAAEIVLIQGDLSILTASQRVEYYAKVCESIGLNPLTKPFDYLNLNGKLVLYAKKDATDQIRPKHGISVYKIEKETTPEGTFDVVAYGRTRDGREDASMGSVSIKNLQGENLANAKMKAETKAKRRLTLSLAGLGMLDETEVGSIPGASPVVVTETGEIVEVSRAPERPTLAAVVQQRVTGAQERPSGDALAPEAPTSPTPEPEAPPVSTEEPEDDGADDMAGVAEAAEAIFAEDKAPGIAWEEFRRMMKERHILSGQVTISASKHGFTGLVKDMSDADRYRLWEAVTDDQRAQQEG